MNRKRTCKLNQKRSILKYGDLDVSMGVRTKGLNTFNIALPIEKIGKKVDEWTYDVTIRVGLKSDRLEYSPNPEKKEPYRSVPYIHLDPELDPAGTKIAKDGYACIYLYFTDNPPIRRIMRKGKRVYEKTVVKKPKPEPNQDMIDVMNHEDNLRKRRLGT